MDGSIPPQDALGFQQDQMFPLDSASSSTANGTYSNGTSADLTLPNNQAISAGDLSRS